jgi:hypothetical protein
MSFVIRVVGPAGMVNYLTTDQREVEFSEDAAHYESPDEAQAVADAYLDVARKCWPCPPMVVVTDLEEDG